LKIKKERWTGESALAQLGPLKSWPQGVQKNCAGKNVRDAQARGMGLVVTHSKKS